MFFMLTDVHTRPFKMYTLLQNASFQEKTHEASS